MWFTDLVQLELWAQVIKVPDFCAAEIGEVELCRLHAKLIDKIANTVCGNLLREMHQHIDSCKQSLRDRVRASAAKSTSEHLGGSSAVKVAAAPSAPTARRATSSSSSTSTATDSAPPLRRSERKRPLCGDRASQDRSRAKR